MIRQVKKPWGHEEIWAENDAYVGKILFIKKGHRLSLQHHVVKLETIRVTQGIMCLELEDENGMINKIELSPGDVCDILPGRKHRMSAITDCEVFEVSTPHLNDVVRHSDDYGRETITSNESSNIS